MEPLAPAHKDVQLEPMGESPPTLCDCCGRVTRSVWGQLSNSAGGMFGVYFVQWTQDGPEHDPAFDLILGPWGDGTTTNDRVGISLFYRASQRSFTVVDASSRPFAGDQDLFARALDRSEVIGTPLAAVAFSAVDAVWLQDTRIKEITQWR